MTNDKVLSLMGLAKKAGKLKSGEYCVENEIKAKSAKLVIVALDASDNTKKHYSDMCSFRHIPIYQYSTKEELGKHIGCEERAALVILDDGFASGIKKEIERNQSSSEVIE